MRVVSAPKNAIKAVEEDKAEEEEEEEEEDEDITPARLY